jgi:PilZ domain
LGRFENWPAELPVAEPILIAYYPISKRGLLRPFSAPDSEKKEQHLAIENTRRSDRITMSLRIKVAGMDVDGIFFETYGHTQQLSRYGAAIRLPQRLAPGQVLLLTKLADGKETEVAVVGQIRVTDEGTLYGVAFEDRDVDFWGIVFPPLRAAEETIARCLMECGGCRNGEVVHLHVEELEVYEANHSLLRYCPKCREATYWKEAQERPEEQDGPLLTPSAAVGVTGEDEASIRGKISRKFDRVKCSLTGCVRRGKEEMVMDLVNLSKGGLCFRCKKAFTLSSTVEIAVPYAQGVANIFVPAKIAWLNSNPFTGRTIHGAQYLKVK